MFLGVNVTEGNEFRESNIFSVIDTSQVANEITNCSTPTDSFLYQDSN